MLDAVRILTAALVAMGVAQLAPAQPVEYDLAIDAAASLSDPGPGGELSAFAPLLYEDDHLLFGDFRAGGLHEFFNLSVGWGARHLQSSVPIQNAPTVSPSARVLMACQMSIAMLSLAKRPEPSSRRMLTPPL